MNKRTFLKSLALVLIIGAGSAHAAVGERLSRADLQRIVVERAVAHGLAPDIALAVARVESSFDVDAVSSAGAVGVMQIMPRTGRDVFGLNRRALFDARINIDTGVRFLKQLYDRYGRMDIALSHYNGGSAVRTASGRLRVIPATRHYVNKVQRHARDYRRSREFRAMVAQARSGSAPSGLSYTAARDMSDDERSRLVRELRRLAAKNLNRSDEYDTAPRPAKTLMEARSKAERRRIIERF